MNESGLAILTKARMADIRREIARERLAQEARGASARTWQPWRFSLRWLRQVRARTSEPPQLPARRVVSERT